MHKKYLICTSKLQSHMLCAHQYETSTPPSPLPPPPSRVTPRARAFELLTIGLSKFLSCRALKQFKFPMFDIHYLETGSFKFNQILYTYLRKHCKDCGDPFWLANSSQKRHYLPWTRPWITYHVYSAGWNSQVKLRMLKMRVDRRIILTRRNRKDRLKILSWILSILSESVVKIRAYPSNKYINNESKGPGRKKSPLFPSVINHFIWKRSQPSVYVSTCPLRRFKMIA